MSFMKKFPQVGVGVIIKNKGKILLLKRKGSHGEGTWAPPGGHLEFNERIEECVKREVIEETGLILDKIKFIGVTNDIFREEGKHYITIFMSCESKTDEVEIKEKDKCAAMGWFEWKKLPEPLFLPLQNLIKQGVVI